MCPLIWPELLGALIHQSSLTYKHTGFAVEMFEGSSEYAKYGNSSCQSRILSKEKSTPWTPELNQLIPDIFDVVELKGSYVWAFELYLSVVHNTYVGSDVQMKTQNQNSNHSNFAKMEEYAEIVKETQTNLANLQKISQETRVQR